MNVSRMDDVFSSRPRTFPLSTIALEMRKGNATLPDTRDDAPARTLAEVTMYARQLKKERGQAAYNMIKEGMPQFLPAVVTSSRHIEETEEFTGLVCLEYDSEEVDTPYAMMLACQNPYVVLAWRSLSGKPKILVRVAMHSEDNEPLSPITFPHAWLTASQLFEEIGEADPTAVRPLQPQNICYDPDIYLNPDAKELEWSVDRETMREAFPQGQNDVTLAFLNELGQEYLDAFERMEFNSQGVGSERVPCPFGGNHESDGWGSRSNATRVIRHGKNDFSLQCFKCPGNKSKRYNSAATPPKRYCVDVNHAHRTSSIEIEREENKKVLMNWVTKSMKSKGKKLLILGSAAGTGKTTVGITSIEQFLYIAKTTEEADQVFEKLFDDERDVIRHRPRLYNIGHTDFDDNPDWDTLPLGLGPHERPCIAPELCNLHAERIGSTHEVCTRCPVYSDCKEDAYLSQSEKERNTLNVIYAWDEVIACDSVHESRVKQICTANDILIVDEANPANLTQQRSITRDILYDITERFRDINTVSEYKALKPFLDLISTAETPETFISGLKAHLETIEDIPALDTKLEKYPVGHVFEKVEGESYNFKATLHFRGKEVTVPVVDYETHEDTAAFEVDPNRLIEVNNWQLSLMSFSFLLKTGLARLGDPPPRYRRLLSDLQTFFDQHSDTQHAPFTFDPKKQTFEFHLKPTLNHRLAIFNTASDPDDLISENYRNTGIDITRHTGTPPAWKTDSVFQIATGNYLPRHSLISGENGDLSLKPRAQQLFYHYIQPSIDAGLKVLIVAPKVFQKMPELERYKDRADVELINHHHAEGRNDYQDFDIVFIFHYEPEHNEVQRIATRTYRNAATPISFEREKRKVSIGGVSFEKMVYADDRVQAVYNRECRARLMQSAMRLRPNINEDKTIVFLTAEPVDIPVTPVPFSPADEKSFDGDWKVFREKLQAKESETNVKTVTERDQVSKRTAYRKTQEARKRTKAERDAEIVRRYAAGETQKAIADDIGVALSTVNSVIQRQPF